MADIVQLRDNVPSAPKEEWEALDTMTAFERFVVIYPRDDGYGRAKQRWMWALVEVNNDFRVILSGAMSARVFHLAEQTPYRFIKPAWQWLADQDWRATYRLPKASVASPQADGRAILRQSMEAKAKDGSQFAQDWLNRNP